MADDRPADDPVAVIAQLQADLADLRSTVLARASRRPTGDIEATIRRTPKEDTLFMQGQIVNRADYPALFQWAVDQGLFAIGLFGPADGVTTFGLPDWRGKVVRGAAGVTGLLTGSDTIVLSVAQLAPHSHAVTVADHGNHNHALTGGAATTYADSGHSHHFAGTQYVAAAGAAWGLAAWNSEGNMSNYHSHDVQVATWCVAASAGSHSVTQSTIGSGSAVDVRQASVDINWAIYT